MKKSRLEAFSDGVFAIIITIMVLELRVPAGHAARDLVPQLPAFFSYALSFLYVGIYWNNHHHMLYLVDRIDGRSMWANLNLLFWLSLMPFVTNWMGASQFALWPVVCYGVDLILCGFGYWILSVSLMGPKGRESRLGQAYGRDFKGKISLVIYAAGIATAFYQPLIAFAIYLSVCSIWIIPDRRVERHVMGHNEID